MNKDNKINLTQANLFARSLASIIDIIMIIIVGIAGYYGLSALSSKLPGVKKYKDDYIETVERSNILVYNNEKDIAEVIVKEKYQEYETMFYQFYNSFLKEEVELEYEHDVYWYNVHVYGLDDEQNLYSKDDLDKNVLPIAKRLGASLFTYELDNANKPLYNNFALPLSYHNDRNATGDNEERLLDFYYMEEEVAKTDEIAKEYQYVYYWALNELTSIPRINEDYSSFVLYASTLPLVISFFIAMMIFYLIIPLCFKDGQTLGKCIMHLCLVNKHGYKVEKWRLIPRALLPTIFAVIILALLGISLSTVFVMGVFILVSFLLSIFTHEHKSLYDLVSGALVVDQRNSNIYKDEAEMIEHEKELEETEIEEKQD